ncbi:tRNA1(Val) (adenine(37)-N6)-methyltransferase [Devosia yakushimensis]|uniref:tRNA1(Val) (adenine(37)-N6)-methyltransferase n=1 Tax=Devosia yakushimensis TaxID=470028 RepID=UPI0024E07887|nr:methyltransferase [Devosia yakushimensis]
MLLGAAVAEDCERLLDLGSGVGTAAFVALAHAPACHGTLVEQNPEMAALARDNAATNGFAARTLVIEADVTAKGGDRKAAGLIENGYDSVIANPPFFEAGAGTLATTTGRAAARHMDAAALDLWVRTAATSAAANGEVIFIYPVESLAPLLAAFSQRFGGLTLLPLAPRPDAPANRVLLRGLKGSRAPLRMLASRALHDAEGRAFRPEFDAIFRGIARLDW